MMLKVVVVFAGRIMCFSVFSEEPEQYYQNKKWRVCAGEMPNKILQR